MSERDAQAIEIKKLQSAVVGEFWFSLFRLHSHRTS
jgi:hypothetical protein